MHLRRALSRALPLALVASGALLVLPGAPAQAKSDIGAKPFMGFSTWSVESSTHPGYGSGWLTEQNVKNAADTLAAKLLPAGYSYLNLDSGWSSGVDGKGVPKADTGRFPDGIKAVVDYIHGKGLKAGIYDVVGLPGAAYDANAPIPGTSCHTRDIVRQPLTQVPNGWGSGTDYAVDYTNSCTQPYYDAVVSTFASWGVDLIKVDGQHLNGGATTADVPADNLAVWSRAIDRSGRPIYLTASGWPVPVAEADALRPYVNGVRVDTDVECYCDTISSWNSSVSARFADLPAWLGHVGGNYWPDLDSMPINNNTGSGVQDGLNDTERQTVMNFWSMASAPLYVGGDVWFEDAKAQAILTNPEVIAVDQSGVVPTQVSGGGQQVWAKRLPDGSTVVGVFNTGSAAATVSVAFSSLGLTGSASVRDLAARADLGTATGSWTANSVPAHGSRLVKLTGAGIAGPGGSGPVTGAGSGKCMDVNGGNTADGATVTLYTCNGGTNQTWTRTGGTFQSLGKCLDVTGGGTANNTNVELWSCNGGGNQQWTTPGDGTIRNPASGRCLDAAGAGTGDGTRLIIWDCNGQSNQKWSYPAA
ncbi:glycoside hydrolase family 27 protein [Actinacidiphila acididurans]|uniref:Alpha-galactosidase n=1 Tax=Actinacidiphila acididurans TaxID=2784346 RepID=A0ABS2TJF6_9ACTN|nr:glycoside hydrolase family 27 protein [Actinacidiphila acididurans]MBM9503488.1 ricin-type beta-trefoil lectin domain protein [Actinacidiphila acididurans]